MTEQIDYDPNTVLEALNNKADRDLNNVTDGTYQVLTTKNITNCITKIPQDIKLELTDGTLALKAGSKVYDGAGNPINVASDIKLSAANAGTFIGFVYNDNSFIWETLDRCFSGDTYTGSVSGKVVWYDTANKIVKRSIDGGSSWLSGTVSLPFVIITGNGTNVASIDQVFNGFGYIGSTIFALPSVEGLIPNGRNEDGSLNNAKFKTTSVLTRTENITGNYILTLGSATVGHSSLIVYDELKNRNFNKNTSNYFNLCMCGTVLKESGRITAFNPKTTFQAIDRNEIDNIIDTRINYRFQVVSELPPVQNPNTFYFIPEE